MCAYLQHLQRHERAHTYKSTPFIYMYTNTYARTYTQTHTHTYMNTYFDYVSCTHACKFDLRRTMDNETRPKTDIVIHSSFIWYNVFLSLCNPNCFIQYILYFKKKTAFVLCRQLRTSDIYIKYPENNTLWLSLAQHSPNNTLWLSPANDSPNNTHWLSLAKHGQNNAICQSLATHNRNNAIWLSLAMDSQNNTLWLLVAKHIQNNAPWLCLSIARLTHFDFLCLSTVRITRYECHWLSTVKITCCVWHWLSRKNNTLWLSLAKLIHNHTLSLTIIFKETQDLYSWFEHRVNYVFNDEDRHWLSRR